MENVISIDKLTSMFIENKKLNFVSKPSNATNMLQCRPIKKCCAIWKAKYSNYTNKKKISVDFVVSIKNTKEVAENSGETLRVSLRKKLNKSLKN